ncbi:MAG: hypothetical protein UHS54_06100 [Lachnospiraceae bacterium]|nr:hypothetical protein [Lachnospiraceae bacterium]
MSPLTFFLISINYLQTIAQYAQDTKMSGLKWVARTLTQKREKNYNVSNTSNTTKALYSGKTDAAPFVVSEAAETVSAL